MSDIHTATLPLPPWLARARAAWLSIALLAVGLTLGGAPGYARELLDSVDRRALAGLGLSPTAYTTYVIGLGVLVVVFHAAMALLIFWRCTHDRWMGLLVALALVTNGTLLPLSLTYARTGEPLIPRLAADLIIYLALLSSMGLLYVFPDGRFVPPGTRWLLLLWAGANFVGVFLPEAWFSFQQWPSLLQVLTLLAWAGTGVAAQAHRYEKVSTPMRRQQTKWAVFGLAASALGPFVYYVPFVILPSLGSPAVPNLLYQRMGGNLFDFSLAAQLLGRLVFAAATLVFPVSFAVAILRFRLWDVDLIIRRTLVYGTLTAALGLIYFASIVTLQGLSQRLTGESQPAWVTVVSTLAIVGLSSPLRQRIQDGIDRRFYRHRYDAARILAAFSLHVRDDVDLDHLAEHLLGAAQETMQPEQASLWLKK